MRDPLRKSAAHVQSWPRAVLFTLLLGALASPSAGGPRGGSDGKPNEEPARVDVLPATSTRRMAELLAALAVGPQMDESPYVNESRALAIESRLAATGNGMTPERYALEFSLATEWLGAGKTEKAIEIFERLHAFAESLGPKFPAEQYYEVASQLAIAHLRLGELENCAARHGVDSCLLPIRGDGVHVEQRGSRAAVARLENLLRQFPGDLRGRWILNIAYMTLGEYPDGVRPEWLIPPEAFESDYPLPRFVDAAPRVGLDVRGHAGGCVVDDFDGDDDLDVMTSSMGVRDQLRYFENLADGTFADRTEQAGLMGLTGGLNLASGDYDNDGSIDVLVLRGGWMWGNTGLQPDSLLHNDGHGMFSDATQRAGLLSFHPDQVGCFGDFDNDGWLDLFMGNESAKGYPHRSELYHNNRDGTFTEVSGLAGVDVVAFVKGAAWGDYDNDGRIDLYVSCYRGTNRLFHNDGVRGDAWHFTDVAEKAGVTEPFSSFPTWFFDYDNDGWLDIFVSDYEGNEGDVAADYLRPKGEAPPSRVGRPCVYRNNRDGTFTDVAAHMGLDDVLRTMGSNYGDLDNDGWLDFYAGTGNPDFRMLVPNRMFRNDGGKRFQDVTTAGGFGHLQKGHGVAFADIDNDGDQDVYAVLGGAFEGDDFRNALFENPGSDNHWIALDLEGTASNRSAIGARIRARVKGDEGPRDIHAMVCTGGSFGASSLRQTIGLGHAVEIERIEITWPMTGRVQVLEDLDMDRMYRVTEGAPAAVPVAPTAIHLGGAGSAAPVCHTDAE